jgi:hypothetical protein
VEDVHVYVDRPAGKEDTDLEDLGEALRGLDHVSDVHVDASGSVVAVSYERGKAGREAIERGRGGRLRGLEALRQVGVRGRMGSAPLGHLRSRGDGGQENLLSIMLAANSNLAMFNPLNASAIYLGQGAGAAIGALVLLYGSLGSLGWVAALCAATSVVVLILGIPPAKQTRP